MAATRSPTDADLSDYLATLPGDPDRIAARLRERGIVGKARNPRCCPVARWLERRWPGCAFHVSHDAAYMIDERGAAAAFAECPRPLWDFLLRIDNGHYPDLIGPT